VIDFGVAKALHQRLTDQTVYTQFAQMVGTPLYMSPEQAGMGVIDVDTRSDVYSLGVVLYELLTGQTPFDREMLKSATFDEMRRIIREEEPKRPSAMVSTLKAEAQSTIAEQRGIDVRKLSDSLSGELDWLVMKTLEKDRSRRYESASDLGADIQRFLDDEPIEACPPSVSYRLSKATRKHRALITTAAAIFVALLIGTGVATWQAVLAGAAAEQAEKERAAAEQNMKAAMDAVERLLANVSNPKLANSPGLQETWGNILKETIEFYDRFKADSGSSPDVDYRAAKVFLQFGHLMTLTKPNSNDVIRSYERGVKLAEAIVLKEPKRNDFRELLAQLHLGCADYYWMPPTMATEEYDAKTEMHFRRAEQQYAHLALENPGDQDYRKMQGACFARMAGFFHRRSPDDPRVEECDQRALELRVDGNRGLLRRARRTGDRKLEAQYWRREIAEYQADPDNYSYDVEFRTHARGHPLWWASLAAKVLADESPDEAEWIWQESIRSSYDDLKKFPSNRAYRQLYDEASWEYSKFFLRPERRMQAMQKLEALIQSEPAFHNVRAEVLENLGDTDDRLTHLTESIRQFPAVAEYYFVRAGIFQRQGDLDRAVADYDQVIELDKDFRRAYQQRGHLCLQEGKYEKAIDDYNRYITMLGHGSYIWKRRALAYFELGRYEEALADLGRAVDETPDDSSAIIWIAPEKVAACPDKDFQTGVRKLADQAVGSNGESAGAVWARAKLLLALGDKKRAQVDIEKALELAPNDGILRNNIAWHYATVFANDSELTKQAVELAEQAVTLQPQSGIVWNTLGVAHYRTGNMEGAIESLEKSEAELKGQYFGYNGIFLAMAHHRLGNKDKALDFYDRSIAWRKDHGSDTELDGFFREAEELLGAAHEDQDPKTEAIPTAK
jgi:tetratricopeptide (TPR) repeat protein